jgi:3-phenylpropionate/trans-cinnamate dioxygenase ferredoxin reductase subunit
MRQHTVTNPYVIVGGGVAGVSAAEALRGAGFDGRVVLVGEEQEYPYQRPPLSKGLLRGEVAPDFASLRSPAFYETNAIELHLGDRVTRIDPHARRVECASGTRFEYDKLLVATGGTPRVLRVPGSDLPGIHYLRTLAQSIGLRSKLQRHPHVLVVGGGFIGCEVAASARQLGCDVAIAGPALPMAHALGPEMGAAYADFHRDHGVIVKTGVTVTEFHGAASLEEAMLSDGSTIACTIAVVGVGIDPFFGMLSDADTSDGLLTDEFCRTSIDNVFAAGDMARTWRPRLNRHARLEHFDNAQLQGAAAARSMCDKLTPYDPIPFFWSDQYDWDLQYYGSATEWDEVVFRGYPSQGSFMAFYRKNGRIDAACTVNRSREATIVKHLLGQHDVPAHKLGDDDIALKTLVAAEAYGVR